MFEGIALTVRRLLGDEPAVPDTTIELAKRLAAAEADRAAAERSAQELRVKRAVTGRPALSTIDEAIDKAASLGDDCAALEAALRDRLERLPESVSDEQMAAERAAVDRAEQDLRAKVTASQARAIELVEELIRLAIATDAQFFREARMDYAAAAAGAVQHLSGLALEMPGQPRLPVINPMIFEGTHSGLREKIKDLHGRRQALSGPCARANLARKQLQASGADDALIAVFDKTIAAQPVPEVTEEVKPPAPQRTGLAVKYLDPATGKTRVACYGAVESAIAAERGLKSNGMRDVCRGWSLEGGGFEPVAGSTTKPPAIAVDDVEADQP
jgi:hypothetical protein